MSMPAINHAVVGVGSATQRAACASRPMTVARVATVATLPRSTDPVVSQLSQESQAPPWWRSLLTGEKQVGRIKNCQISIELRRYRGSPSRDRRQEMAARPDDTKATPAPRDLGLTRRIA